ncbi:MAG: hypothetical protein EKK59_09080, partial [Neisseriaceae bacterium]
MQDSQLNTVNPFYLQRVVKLAEHSRIVTSDDVYAANGMKLLAKGTPISHEVQDRLIKHKLKKPLESSLSVADAIDPQYLVALAQDVLASQTKLQPILFFGNHGGQALEILQGLALNGPMRMVLTMLERSGNEELRQSVECALVALVLGIELGLAQERLQHLAIGSLL